MQSCCSYPSEGSPCSQQPELRLSRCNRWLWALASAEGVWRRRGRRLGWRHCGMSMAQGGSLEICSVRSTSGHVEIAPRDARRGQLESSYMDGSMPMSSGLYERRGLWKMYSRDVNEDDGYLSEASSSPAFRIARRPFRVTRLWARDPALLKTWNWNLEGRYFWGSDLYLSQFLFERRF